MRLDRLPKSMVVLGGGYIAAEMSLIFGSLGTQVTIVARGEHLLSRHDADIRARFTEAYRKRFDVRLGATVKQVAKTRKGVRLDLVTPSGAQAVEGEVLLVATGRVPTATGLMSRRPGSRPTSTGTSAPTTPIRRTCRGSGR